MKPKTISMVLTAADRNGICAAQTPGGAGNLTIDGALASGGAVTLTVPRHISIYAAGDESARTFTVTGTDRKGNAMTEAITGPNATTVKGSKNFKTVTQIAVDAGTAGDVEVGDADEGESQWVPVEYRIVNQYQTLISYPDAATMQAQVQSTQDDPFTSSFDEHTCNTIEGDPGSMPVRAIRMKISDHVTGTPTLNIVCS
jgi:VCBS repeat-containing protein